MTSDNGKRTLANDGLTVAHLQTELAKGLTVSHLSQALHGVPAGEPVAIPVAPPAPANAAPATSKEK